MKVHPAVSNAIATSTSNPARAAREAIATNPDLADQPFGKLVSSFARGLPVGDAQPSTTEVSPPTSDSPLAPTT
jgi:hypothetical protein